MSKFVHLHVHSKYSLLDGTISIPSLIAATKNFGMNAVALTDHGVMYGLVEFFQVARKEGIKPILGVEAYLALKGRKDRTHKNQTRHLVLLAKNKQGYDNMVKLISLANIEGFYYKPRIDHELLEKYHEGLIALSACLSGEIPRAILEGRMDAAYDAARWYKDLFGDDFYIELQRNGLERQDVANAGLIQIARDLGIKMVATTDAHFLKKDEKEAHDVILCVGSKTTLSDPKRFRIETDEVYFKSSEEMEEAFADLPEVLANTLEIADKVEEFDITRKRHILPRYQTPSGESEEEYLRTFATEGLKERLAAYDELPVPEKDYFDRLNYELDIINRMGYAGYYLIVADFINWAKNHGIFVGPGRGSGAGSIVAWAIRITNIDPLRYNLLFERFLNPERNSMPDFDVDFENERRDEVIAYLYEKYGAEHVAQIVTFQNLKARAAVHDVARVLEIPPSYANALAKMIPDRFNFSSEEEKKKYKGLPALDIALVMEPKLKEKYDNEPDAKRIIDIARLLEGSPRQTGKHPGGTIISPEPIYDVAPVFVDKDKNTLVVQYHKGVIDDVGLVKFDLLGLKTLSVIQTAINLVNEQRAKEGKEPLDERPLNTFDDPNVFALYSRGDTDNVFQAESEGFKKMLRELKPDSLEEIIAAVSLYRPGPMDFIPTLVRRKWGQEKIEYELPQLEKILKETYGVIVYQEQVMQIAVEVAGFTMGEADILRKAMGKKKPKIMEEMRAKFIEGALAKGFDKKTVEDLYDKIEKFAGYGFNKSHAAAYAVLSYQTAWLKNYYPVEFMAAVLTVYIDNVDTVIKNLVAVKKMGIEILPPSINRSLAGFSAEDGAIRFGLKAVKGVGGSAIEAILQEREENGEFADLPEFCTRVDLRKVNKSVIDALIRAGAFDFTGKDRASLVAVLEKLYPMAQAVQKQKQDHTLSLFDAMGGNSMDTGLGISIDYPDVSWTELERLQNEKSALGLFLSGHPLTLYSDVIDKLGTVKVDDLYGITDPKREVLVAGVLDGVVDKPLRNGKGRYARGVIDTPEGRVRFLMNSQVYDEFGHLLEQRDVPMLISGTVKFDETEVSDESGETQTEITFIVSSLQPLEEVRYSNSKRIVVEIPHRCTEKSIRKLQNLLRSASSGTNGNGTKVCPVILRIHDVLSDAEVVVHLPDFYKVPPRLDTIEEMRRVFGRTSVWTE